jgi:predicted Fe-Mo cluster-binding NifX family protein
MKVVVTSTGETMDSPVDPRFGRARVFMLVDTETGEHQAVDNASGVNASGGAGVQAGEKVSKLGAEILITGHCGPNAFRTLQAVGVKVVIGAEGTVAEAIEKFKRGELSPTGNPDVEGHWA